MTPQIRNHSILSSEMFKDPKISSPDSKHSESLGGNETEFSRIYSKELSRLERQIQRDNKRHYPIQQI